MDRPVLLSIILYINALNNRHFSVHCPAHKAPTVQQVSLRKKKQHKKLYMNRQIKKLILNRLHYVHINDNDVMRLIEVTTFISSTVSAGIKCTHHIWKSCCHGRILTNKQKDKKTKQNGC